MPAEIMKNISKFLLLQLVILCFLVKMAVSQTCIPVFKNLYGGTGNDEAKDILYTPDGGSVIVGQTTSNAAGGYDAFILKLDAQGTIVWSRQFGGSLHDDLGKIKLTSDGGYISIGNSKSYGVSNQEVIVVKLDVGGNLSWARHIGSNSAHITSKDIIQLTDGNYVLVANENDSSAQSNGIVCKLDGSGNTIWTKTFDHGNDDGFNNVAEDGANIYITGYATIDRRDAILLQLDKINGNVNYARKVVIGSALDDEMINLHIIQDGIAFGVKSTNPVANFFSRLTLFKMRNNGQVFYERYVSASTDGGNKIAGLDLIGTNDSGFLYVVRDTSPYGFSKAVFIGPNGLSEWGRKLYVLGQPSHIVAADNNGTNGFLYAGYASSFATNFRNKISVYKTNSTGNVGNGAPGVCTEGWIGAFEDTSHAVIQPFTWNLVNAASVSNGAMAPVMINTEFAVTNECVATDCTGGPVILEGCSSTFSMKYQSDRLFYPWDVTPTNDGGAAIVGGQYVWHHIAPLLCKLKPNGDIQWSGTINDFINTGFFKKVITAPDGNLVLLAYSNRVIDHGSTNLSKLLKINSNTGQVIWSYSYLGTASDIALTDNGGFVLSLNSGWGGGSPYTYVLRLDGNGNIVWQKQFFKFTGGPVYKSIIFEAPYIYMAADMYLGNPNTVQVVKLDAATGNKVWIKRYSVNGETSLLQGIRKIGDTLCVAISMPTAPNLLNPGMICLDLNGNEIRSFKIQNPAYSSFSLSFEGSWNEHIPYNLIKTSDDNFIIADQLTGSPTSVAITKFSTTGSILWARRYPALTQSHITGVKEKAGSLYLFGARFLGAQNTMQIRDAYLLKTDINGDLNSNTGSCNSETIAAGISPIAITSQLAVDDSLFVSTDITMQTYSPYIRPVNIWAEVSCNVNATCSSVDVLGISSTCSLVDTLTYTIQRNPGCQIPVTWETNPLNTTVIAFTDTTIKVKYLQHGQTHIIAKLMTGCGIFADTLFVNVRRNAASLYLGPDTSVCAGNTIILRAGQGFKTYLWHNGSVADTFLVNTPGLYYVDVTDSCDNIARDSVAVNEGATVSISLGPDKEKCNNDTLQLWAPAGFLNYTWSPDYNISALNTQMVIVNPAVDTSYFIKAEKTSGCFGFDTVHIKVFHSPLINLGGDTSLCAGQSLVLNAGPGFANYVWNNGNTGMQITVNMIGTFHVTGIDANGCKSSDTINVLNIFPLPLVNLDNNPELCSGSGRILDAGMHTSYLWQDGSLGRTFNAGGLGTYYVRVTDAHGCAGEDTTYITSIVPSPTNFLGADTTICSGNSILLTSNQAFNSYLWSTGSSLSTASVSQPDSYWLQVTNDNNCIGRDSITIYQKHCFSGIFVPNSFTPDNDGRNDKAKVTAYGTLDKFEFIIYNRYGQIVFHTKDINEGWDGIFSGTRQNPGTYVWTCRYRFVNKLETLEQGYMILIK